MSYDRIYIPRRKNREHENNFETMLVFFPPQDDLYKLQKYFDKLETKFDLNNDPNLES